MKIVALFVFTIAAAVSADDRETIILSKEIVDKIYKSATDCANQNNVDVAMIPRLADGTLPRDDATNKFLYCFTLNMGYIAEDGHMIAEKLTKLLKDHPLQEKFRESINKCNEVTKENPIATVVEMNKCFANDTPVRVRLY